VNERFKIFVCLQFMKVASRPRLLMHTECIFIVREL